MTVIDEKEYNAGIILLEIRELKKDIKEIKGDFKNLIIEHNQRIIGCSRNFVEKDDLIKVEKKVDENRLDINDKFRTRDKWAQVAVSLGFTNLVAVLIALMKLFVTN